MRMLRTVVLTTCLPLVPLAAQSADHAAVLAVADSALAAVTRSDFVAFTDLMVDEGVVVATSVRDGVASTWVRTRATERAYRPTQRLTERGWNPTVQLQAGIATVWYPYDFYVNGAWSHCGVDTFTLVKRADRWLIVTLAYTVEQPPACEKHPAGPPNP